MSIYMYTYIYIDIDIQNTNKRNFPRTNRSQITPSIEFVSKFNIRTLINSISLRAFSNITLASSESHRRIFGANTIDKLFTSIFVTTTFSDAANTYKIKHIFIYTYNQIIQKLT